MAIASCIDRPQRLRVNSNSANKHNRLIVGRPAIFPIMPTMHALAVLTGNDDTKSLMAQSIQVQARIVKELFGAKLERVEGLTQCTNCSRITLEPIPKGTTDVAFQVDLPAGEAGYLYADLLSF